GAKPREGGGDGDALLILTAASSGRRPTGPSPRALRAEAVIRRWRTSGPRTSARCASPGPTATATSGRADSQRPTERKRVRIHADRGRRPARGADARGQGAQRPYGLRSPSARCAQLAGLPALLERNHASG